jgi:hypothetical protein
MSNPSFKIGTQSHYLRSGTVLMLVEMWLNKCAEYWPKQQREEEKKDSSSA